MYVNATDGNDLNGGGQFAPVQSFETAYNLASDGQWVCVAAGEYFRAADADGIVLADGSKSVAFLLQSFGGDSEIRFSEEFFVADPGAGVLSFQAAAGETLHFGKGILNTNSIHPGELNFLHTFEVRSGVLDFGDVPVSFGESVGNTLYKSPENPDKHAPASAGIRLSGVFSHSDLNVGTSPRRWFISGNAGSTRQSPISTLPANSQLITDSGDPISFPDGISLEENSLWRVSQPGIQVTGAVGMKDGATLEIDHSGDLSLGVDVASGARSTILKNGSGQFELIAVAYGASAALDIRVLGGSMALNAQADLRGSLLLGSAATLTVGAVSNWIPVDPNVDTMTLNGAVEANTGVLRAASPVSQSTIRAESGLSWNGAPLEVSGIFELVGQGRVPVQLSGAADLALTDVVLEGGLSVTTDQVIRFRSSSANIAGELHLEGGNVTIQPTLEPGVERLVVESGQIVGNGSILSIVDLARITGGTVSDLGLAFNSSQAAFLSSSQPLKVLQSASEMLTLSSDVAVSESCSLLGGGLVIPAGVSLSCGSMTDNESGTISLGPDSGLISNGITDLRGLALSGEAGATIASGSQLLTDHTSGTELVTLRWLTPSSEWVSSMPAYWEQVIWDYPDGQTILDGQAGFFADLDLSTHTITLSEGSVLRVQGNLAMSAAPFGDTPQGTLLLEGSSTLTGAPGLQSVLPGLSMSSGNLSFDANVSIMGDFAMASGVTLLREGRIVESLGTCTPGSGEWRFESGSHLSCSGSISAPTGRIVFLGGSAISGGSDILVESEVFGSEFAELNTSSTGTIALPPSSRWKALNVSGVTNLVAPSNDPYSIEVIELLSIAQGASLDLGPHSVTIGQADGAGGHVANEGTVSSLTGSLIFVGNGGELSGTRLPETTVIDLSESSKAVEYTGSSLLAGSILELKRGSLDLGTASFTLQEDIVFELMFKMDGDATLGDLVVGLPAVFNPENRSINLTIDGTVEGFPSLDPFLVYGPIHNLTISAVDALNDPPLFGLRSVQPIAISGRLEMSPGSRLDIPEITLSGIDEDHVLGGLLSSVRLTGSGTISGQDLGRAESLVVQGGSFELGGIVSIGAISLNDAHLSIGGTGSLAIGSALGINASTLSLSTTVNIGKEGSVSTVSIQSGTLEFDRGGSLTAVHEANVFSDAGSVWSLGEAINPGSGYLDFQRGGTLAVGSSLPRLKLSSEGATLRLNAPATVTDKLDLESGAFNLNTHSLIVESATWTQGAAGISGSPGPILPFVSTRGSVLLLLGATLDLEQVHLNVEGQLKVESSGPDPQDIRVPNGTFTGTNGSLILGQSDLTVSGLQSPLIQLEDFAISSEVYFSEIADKPWFGVSPSLLPFRDDTTGELVFNGSDGATLVSRGVSSIDALRLQRSASLNAVDSPIEIGKRLVFGANNASLLLGAENMLEIQDEGIIVRNGAGILSHSPVALGRLHLAYNLDDGDVLGQEPGFAGSILNTGAEIPENGTLGRLSIFAGDGETGPRTVRLQQDLSVTSLGLFGGVFDQNGHALDLQAGADIQFIQIESDLPPSWGGSGAVQTTNGAVLNVSLDGQSMTLPSHLLSSIPSWDAVSVQLETSTAQTGAVLILDGSVATSTMTVVSESGSGLNMFGATLTAGDFELNGGGLISEPVSRLIVENHLTTTSNSAIQGNIMVESHGIASLNGTINTLSVQSTGDLAISGSWNARTRLQLSGHDTVTLISRPSFALDNVTVGASAADARIIIRSTEALTFSIRHGLELDQGVLVLENVELLLENTAQLTHHTGTWISGPLSRGVTAGFTGSVSFPVGGLQSSKTLQLVLTEPLVAASVFGVSLIESEPVIETGLPVAIGTNEAQDTGQFHWALTSTVNFANVQPFSLASPRSLHATSALSLITRSAGLVSTPWIADDLSSSSTLRSAILTSGLNPKGLTVTTAQNNRNGERAWVQLIRDAPQDSSYPDRILLNGQLATTLSSAVTASSQFPVSVDNSGSITAALEYPGSTGMHEPIASTAFSVLSDQLHYVMMGQSADGSPVLTTSGPRSGTGVVFFNQKQAPDRVRVTKLWPEPVVLTASLPGRNFSQPVMVDASESAWSISGPQGSEGFVHFIDGNPSDQLSLILIGPDRSATLVDSNGSIRRAADATDVQDDTSTLPEALAISDLYPNPAAATAYLKLDLPTPGSVSVEITDMIGRQVWNSVFEVSMGTTGHELAIPVSRLASGVYSVSVHYSGQSGRHELAHRLMVVRR